MNDYHCKGAHLLNGIRSNRGNRHPNVGECRIKQAKRTNANRRGVVFSLAIVAIVAIVKMGWVVEKKNRGADSPVLSCDPLSIVVLRFFEDFNLRWQNHPLRHLRPYLHQGFRV